MPSRTAANQLYVPELDRIVLKDKVNVRWCCNHASNHLNEFESILDFAKNLWKYQKCKVSGTHNTRMHIHYEQYSTISNCDMCFVVIPHQRKAAITTRVVQLIYEICAKGIHVTKRCGFVGCVYALD